MEESIRKEIIMIPLSAVARFKWDKSLGSRLQTRRKSKKYSRSALAQKINEIDPMLEPCTIGQIQKYEEAVPQAIAADLATAIAIALNIDLPSLLGVNAAVLISTESEKIV
jgi:transcriptional regulator with XRE-family HTH domain